MPITPHPRPRPEPASYPSAGVPAFASLLDVVIGRRPPRDRRPEPRSASAR